MARAKKKKELTLEEKLEEALVPREEWPYEVPENWCWTRVNSVCQLCDGEKRSNEKYPYLEVKYLRGNISANIKDSGKFVKAQTKLILVDGENSGEVFETLEDGYMGSTFKRLNISKLVDEKYLLYYVASKRDLLKNNKTGSAIPHLNKKMFFSLGFSLPPLAEQKRIVKQIESLFDKLDEAKEKAEEVVESAESRKNSVLMKSFSGELTKKWRKENNLSLSMWNDTTVNEIVELLSGQDFKPEKYNANNLGIPYITGASNFENNHILINRWTEEPSVIAKKDDVLLVCKGSFGKVMIADFEKAHIARQIMSLRVKSGINNEFLFYYLESKYKYFMQNAKGLIPGISRKVVLNMKIALPSMAEQKEIVRLISEMIDKEKKTLKNCKNVIKYLDLMKKSILAKAFRGELATNNPEEESSIELLKNILKG